MSRRKSRPARTFQHVDIQTDNRQANHSKLTRAVLEALETRKLLANVIGHSWLVETAPQQLVVQFDTDMQSSLAADHPDVSNVTTDTSLTGASLSFSTDGKTAKFIWPNATGSARNHHTGVLPDGNYRFVLSKSDLPSLAADDVFDFFVKTADADHNRAVNVDDYNKIDNGFNNHLTGFSNGDFNYDGVVNSSDYTEIDARYGTTLQAPPNDPGTPTASALSSSEVVLNWQGIEWEVGEPQPTGIRVQRSTDGHTWDWTQNLPADATSFTNSGLPDGTRYYYRSRYYGNGFDSAYSPKVYATTVLPSVSHLNVTDQGDGHTLVTWTNEAAHATDFRVYWTYNGAFGAVTDQATVSGQNTLLVNNGTNHIRGVTVVALNEHTVAMPVDDGDGGGNSDHRFVSASGDATTNEGAVYTLHLNGGTGSTPITQWIVQWGDGTADDVFHYDATAATHHFQDGSSSHDVKATAQDGHGYYNTNVVHVHVNNVAPLGQAVSTQHVSAGSNFRVTLGTFSDPGFGSGETFSATIDWGDNSATSAGQLTITTAGSTANATVGTISGGHVYSAASNYPVTVTLSDDDGGSVTLNTHLIAEAPPSPYEVPSLGSGPTDLTFQISNLPHGAVYKNELGYFYVNSDFSISTTQGDVQPSDAGYITAALTERPNPVIFNQEATSGTAVTVSVPAGKLLAFFVVQDDTTYDYLHNTVSTGWTYNEVHGPPHQPAETNPLRPNVWFMNAAANRDGHYQHFHATTIDANTKLYEVEDLAGGGDQDFNDLVFTVGPGITDHAPHFTTEPDTYFEPTEIHTPPSQFTVNATIRDFHPHWPSDFQHDPGSVRPVVPGLVQNLLNPATGPALTSNANLVAAKIESSNTFAKWFADDPSYNVSTTYPITFARGSDGMYRFNEPGHDDFYPINGRLFGNETDGGQVNGNFTAEIHTTFTYHDGQTFTFNGDDDVWVFFNRRLGIDLGGIHDEPAQPSTVTLNSSTAAQFGNLVEGQTYAFDMYYAERFIGSSHFYAETNIPLGRNYTYAYPSRATDPDPGDTLHYSIVNGPSGAVIDEETGDLTWQPPQAADYTFKIKVADQTGLYDTQQWNLNVENLDADRPPEPVEGAPEPPPHASVGRHYEAAIDRNFFDPDGDPLTFVPASPLPSWLTLDPDGLLHGTPTATAPQTDILIKVLDGRGDSAVPNPPYHVQVDYYAPDPPVILPVTLHPVSGLPVITWGNSPENDVIGYDVYRSDSATGSFTKLNTDLLPKPEHAYPLPSFTDNSPRIGFPGYYHVVAVSEVDAVHKESQPSPVQKVVFPDETIPHTPDATIIKNGTDAVLTWDPSDREDDVYKYEVYGGADPGALSLITAFDLAAPPTYTDHDAAAQHHDYFAIKAVDYSEHRSDPATLIFKQTMASISISPSALVVPLSTANTTSQQEFTATCLDQFGVPMSDPGDFIWSVTGDGTIDSLTGVYTAPTSGTGATIVASSGQIDSRAYVGLGVDDRVAADALFTTAIMLTWSTPPQQVEYYQVFRSTTPDFRADQSTLVAEPPDPAWQDNYLDPGATYYYQIFAEVGTDSFAFLGTASATTLTTNPTTDPAAPYDVKAASVNDLEMLVTWHVPSQAFPAYLVQIWNGTEWDDADLVPSNAKPIQRTIVRRSGPNDRDLLVQNAWYKFKVAGCGANGALAPNVAWSADSPQVQVEVHGFRDMIVVVGPGNWSMDMLLDGITINDPASGQNLLSGQQGRNNGVARIWADLVNDGYNAFLTPDNQDALVDAEKHPIELKQLDDGHTIYTPVKQDGSGLVYDEMLYEGSHERWHIGLIGWSFGGGNIDNISKLYFNDPRRSFLSSVVYTATIDGIKYPSDGTPMTQAPGRYWSNAYNANWWENVKGGKKLHGEQFPGAHNYGPWLYLDHGAIGKNNGILSMVRDNVEGYFELLG